LQLEYQAACGWFGRVVEKFLDRSELAEMAGLDPRTVQGFENDEWPGGSRLSTIRKLAEALGVDPREIIED
jgi:transcriptional regulator with XRE-family HTH domain